ncbi:NADH-quinone oxidoreductase subunit K [Coraliomargarita algicola]|uniref:NADH-quinone oxidoreductase subunit K n=2 Tax=Coraliomargaritaceae TaxID=3056371 RepID=A0ABU1ALE8_9BACT|nr:MULTISPECIES: NADH-quinone oxidoreductase subunit K [unclassified Coraliomargarita]MDQ8194586.1 NADH-quinone oxidoreductase subunit K [Coraliomargarita sp. SDUM461004]WPJ95272.1 NADH-quinone oxidoreductase subunit K [Coraliomargarita sp. J2-16]
MESLIAVLVGVLFATGTYCLMRRSIVKLVIGVVLISQGANLLVFTTGGLLAGRPALVPADGVAPPAPFGDPLPQAMVLTAIVIGFGLTAFLLALVTRAHEAVGDDDINAFNNTDT